MKEKRENPLLGLIDDKCQHIPFPRGYVAPNGARFRVDKVGADTTGLIGRCYDYLVDDMVTMLWRVGAGEEQLTQVRLPAGAVRLIYQKLDCGPVIMAPETLVDAGLLTRQVELWLETEDWSAHGVR